MAITALVRREAFDQRRTRAESGHMGRLASFAGGLFSGGLLGALLGLLFTPDSGDEMRRQLRARYRNAVAAGSAAADLKRLELEAELARLTAATPAGTVAPTPPAQRPGGRS